MSGRKGWLTGLDKQSTREGRTADNVRRKNRGGAPRGGACWKSCAGASQARPGMVSRQSTAYPDEEQRDSTCVTTVPPKWPMTAWDTACGDYFRVTIRKLARPLNTSAFYKGEGQEKKHLWRLEGAELFAALSSPCHVERLW